MLVNSSNRRKQTKCRNRESSQLRNEILQLPMSKIQLYDNCNQKSCHTNRFYHILRSDRQQAINPHTFNIQSIIFFVGGNKKLFPIEYLYFFYTAKRLIHPLVKFPFIYLRFFSQLFRKALCDLSK